MNTELQLTIYRLAHENNMTVDRFVARLQEIFHVDTSDYPKTEDGDVIYPDGKIGLALEAPDHEELMIHEAAERQGITTNQFVENAIQAAIEKIKIENPESFKDLDDKN